MKKSLTDLIAGGLGDNVLIYRKDLNAITGGVIGSIMLGQLIYWAAKNDYKPFYKFIQPCGHALYKEGDSWAEELGVDDKTISRNFKKFEELGILIRKTDLNRLTWHTINKEILDELLKENLSLAKTPNGGLYDKTPNRVASKTPNGDLYTYTENTAKTTTNTTFSAGENSQFANSENSQNVKSENEKAVDNYLYGNRWDNRWLLPRDKPPFISDEVWADYCAFKRERGQKVVRTELKAFLAQLEKAHNLGVDVNARIIECISKGYASPVLEPRANETNAKSKKGANTESVNSSFDEWLNKYHANEQDEIIDAYCENKKKKK